MLSRYLGVNGAGGEGLFLPKKRTAVNSKWIKRVIELIKTGNQRKVCLDCHQGSNSCRELDGVAVAQDPSSPCL